MSLSKLAGFLLLILWPFSVRGEPTARVVDIPTRPNVKQRLLVLTPENPKAAVLLFAGGHGGLKIAADGSFAWGKGNFLVRSRQLFVNQGLLTVIVDTPSDRENLSGFRQTAEHTADVKAIIAWVRQQANIPVWLVGTSRGTQSVAYVAVSLNAKDGPDGIVLTSTILTDDKSTAVPRLPMERVKTPVLIVHHELDGCSHCAFRDTSALMKKLQNASRKELLPSKGGQSRGDPCEAYSYHGFNGIEETVVAQIAKWILAK